MPTFAEQIRDHRENAGLTQGVVARRLGIDPSLVSRFEGGERLPTRHRLKQLTRIYDLSSIQVIDLLELWYEAEEGE